MSARAPRLKGPRTGGLFLLLRAGLAVGQPAARLVNRCGVNCRVANLNKRDLSIHVHNIGDTVRHAVGTKYAVGFRGGTIFEIAEEGE